MRHFYQKFGVREQIELGSTPENVLQFYHENGVER